MIETIDSYYPDSAFHAKVKRKAKQILKELEKENPNQRKLFIMFRSLEGIKR